MRWFHTGFRVQTEYDNWYGVGFVVLVSFSLAKKTFSTIVPPTVMVIFSCFRDQRTQTGSIAQGGAVKEKVRGPVVSDDQRSH